MSDPYKNLLSLKSAKKAMLCSLNHINKTEIKNLKDCEDRILAKDIFSEIHVPEFDNSAVDGFGFINSNEIERELEIIGENQEAQSILWKASKILGKLTNKRWILSVTNKSGFKSLSEIEQLNYERKVEQIKKKDSIKKILDIIPSSEVTSVKEIEKENIKNKEKK